MAVALRPGDDGVDVCVDGTDHAGVDGSERINTWVRVYLSTRVYWYVPTPRSVFRVWCLSMM